MLAYKLIKSLRELNASVSSVLRTEVQRLPDRHRLIIDFSINPDSPISDLGSTLIIGKPEGVKPYSCFSESPHYLYICRLNPESDLYKIGITKAPEVRLKQLREIDNRGLLSMPFGKEFGSARDARKVEALIHEALSARHEENMFEKEEWFHLTPAEIMQLIALIAPISYDYIMHPNDSQERLKAIIHIIIKD